MTNTTMVDITPIIEAVLGLVMTIITVIIAPKLNAWVKNKLTTHQLLSSLLYKLLNKFTFIRNILVQARKSLLWIM